MPLPYPVRRRNPLDRMGYGKPWHALTEAERATRNADWVYAHTNEEWLGTDLPGRRMAGPISAGAHEPIPGRPHGDAMKPPR